MGTKMMLMESSSFESKKPLLSTPQKPIVDPAAVVTPDRADPSLRIRLAQSAALLPEKYEILCELFTALVNLIRVFRLKRQSATLSKLSLSVESLTNRRFTLHNLAQLKYIVPEVIAVKKICVLDEETSCMKEELLVSLETDALETDQSVKGSGRFSHLKRIFLTRISDYASAYPEANDVPEGELPDMFYKPKQEPEQSVNVWMPSLTSPSFRRRFSSKVRTALDSESSPAKPTSCLPETPIKDASSAVAKQDPINSEIDVKATPAKFAPTPAKLASTPAMLMAATPALNTPKRSLTSADDESEGLPNNRSAKRRVMFEMINDDTEDQKSDVFEDEKSVPQFQCSAASEDL